MVFDKKNLQKPTKGANYKPYFNYVVNFCLIKSNRMDLQTKKERIVDVKECLKSYFRNVENIGAIFFVSGGHGCVLRDVVYQYATRKDLYFEVFALDKTPYFVGSLEHAEALEKIFGGNSCPSEYCFKAINPLDLWTWSPASEMEELSLEDAKTALF